MPAYVLSLGAIAGMLAVLLGAFGAHALHIRLDSYTLGIYNTAVQYQFFHALALIAVGLSMRLRVQSVRLLTVSAYCFTVGIIFFCGSLYLLALGGPRWLGPVTPFGGLCFAAGWFCLALAGWKQCDDRI
ncbi:MAG: DUF423 domain-containing protein [Parahaliea sp.]